MTFYVACLKSIRQLHEKKYKFSAKIGTLIPFKTGPFHLHTLRAQPTVPFTVENASGRVLLEWCYTPPSRSAYRIATLKVGSLQLYFQFKKQSEVVKIHIWRIKRLVIDWNFNVSARKPESSAMNELKHLWSLRQMMNVQNYFALRIINLRYNLMQYICLTCSFIVREIKIQWTCVTARHSAISRQWLAHWNLSMRFKLLPSNVHNAATFIFLLRA